MKLQAPPSNRGIALIIVMLVIGTLAVLAGTFAFSMKVEAKLARNTTAQTDLEWVGRSAVEYAKFFLGECMNLPNEQYDSLNQMWAGGPMGTNEILINFPLKGVQLGPATFDIEFEDLERYYNINIADDFAIRQALILMAADDADADTIVGSILDWIDTDDNTHSGGNESNYYEGLNPPYYAKNGPIDDLSELLLIRGITPEIYWGPKVNQFRNSPLYLQARFTVPEDDQGFSYAKGFIDFFTPISAGLININTAGEDVLQLIPGIDQNIASGILTTRAGLDGVEGTDDDVPYRSPGELINVPGMPAEAVQNLSRVFTVRSATFRATIKATSAGQTATWKAVILRQSPTDIQLLSFYQE